MKNSKKNFGSTGQSTTDSKTSQKHDANLQKNSALYFQIGLILCLLGTYFLFEMQFQDKVIVISKEISQNDIIYLDEPPKFKIEVVKPKEQKVERSKVLKDDYKVVEDDKVVIETKIFTPSEDPVIDEPVIDPNSKVLFIEEPEEKPVIIDFVQKVPVYPGCEKYTTNKKRRKCMSDKINKLVRKKFNGDIAGEYGLKGKQLITSLFTIDKNGKVTDVKIRALHPALEKEANRVINKIPDMQPGIQQDKPVGVLFTLPIVFDVQN